MTSYDYDAPISEAGHYTPKYDALRQTLAKYAPGKLPKAPKEIPVMAVPEFSLTEVAPLMANLPEPVSSEEVLTMEDLDMGFGSVLYRTPLPSLPDGAILRFDGHDYAQVFVNGRYIGKLDRRVNERELRLPATDSGDTLDILVEAMGRINFGRAIKDYKGITSKVLLTAMHDGRPFTCDLRDWQIYPLPDELEFYTSRTFAPSTVLPMPTATAFPASTAARSTSSAPTIHSSISAPGEKDWFTSTATRWDASGKSVRSRRSTPPDAGCARARMKLWCSTWSVRAT